MGLLRLIILAIVIYLVYQLIKRWRGNLPARTQHKAKDATGRRIEGNMVRCHQCGLFLPKEESIQSGGKFYCSEAHRLADGKDS